MCFGSALGNLEAALGSLGFVATGVNQASAEGLRIGWTTGAYDGVGIVLSDQGGNYYTVLFDTFKNDGGNDNNCRYDRSGKNTHCKHMANKFSFPGGACQAWGVDFEFPITVGAQQDLTVLFFQLTGI